MPDKSFDISLIVPCHNEEGNVTALTEAVTEQFCSRGIACELVFVDDGSIDGTLAELHALAGRTCHVPETPYIEVVSFSRNFGKESAMYAGLQAARGTTLCFIDADLQQNPATAYEMYELLLSHPEYDVVATYQDERNEGAFISWVKNRFYRMFNATSDEIELSANMSDFRVFRRNVAEALLSMPEYHRFTKGLFAWVGFNTYAIPYTADKRIRGESSWNMRSLLAYGFSGITAFSTWPLKMLKFVGGLFAVLSGLYLLYVVIVEYLIRGIDVPGYATLVCLILLFGGMQLAAIGIVGDYLARGYIEGKHRPIYIARESFGSDDKTRS